jgi:hypothetical protein
MVYIEEQNQSLSLSFLRRRASKWAITWTNTFIFSLKHPQFVINRIPFLEKKENRFLLLEFASSAQLTETY